MGLNYAFEPLHPDSGPLRTELHFPSDRFPPAHEEFYFLNNIIIRNSIRSFFDEKVLPGTDISRRMTKHTRQKDSFHPWIYCFTWYIKISAAGI
jgi:hypothetical protein